MSVVPEDFLAVAKQVDLSINNEIDVRTAISRAYYAAYHQARGTFPADAAFAKTSGFGVHESYIEQLMQFDPGTPERATAVKLKTMKGRRTIADYRLDDDVRAVTAAQQNAAADDIFEILNRLKTLDKSEDEVQPSSESAEVKKEHPSSAIVCEKRPTLKRLK